MNIGKLIGWIAVALLVIFLIIVIRGYVLQLNEAQEDKEIRERLLQTRLNRI